MDSVTHSLTGLMMSRAGLNRWCPRATAVVLIAVNIPDVDFAAALGGDLGLLEFRRGPTHGLLWMPAMALAPLAVMLLVARKGMRWWRAYVVSLLGLASHYVLDWTNIYGARFLAPVSEQWFRLEITGVIDLWIWLILFLAAAWLLLSRLVSSEIGARAATGRAIAIFALVALLVFCFGRYVLHERAVNVLEARLYSGAAPRRTAAFPHFASPFRWTGLVETDAAYLMFDMDLLQERFDPAGGRTYYKAQPSEAIEAARQTVPFQRFLRFSEYPLWGVMPMDEPEGAVRVQVTDPRFSLPGEDRFVATAVVDNNYQVLRSWFQFEPPAAPRLR